jgi:hypothetical protein
VWFDEEPDEDIYTEGLTRTNATKGIVYMTFTPLKGMSNVVRRFLQEKPPGTNVTQMTIEDALHYSASEREAIASTYKAHERDARLRGIPILGSGRVFPFPDEMVMEYPMQIPAWWPRLAAIDFGYEHPTGIVWGAWDRDTDTIHIYDAYRVKEGTPAVHSAVLRAKGVWIPVVWPHDGETRDGRGSGISLAQQYRDLGVNMHREKATLPPARGQKEGEGGNSTEAGITMMFDRMQTGRLKVARHLNDWFEEFRLYHRKDGLVVKEMDDLMSATRNLVTMIRHAKVKEAPRSNSVRDFVPTVSGMGMG